MNTNLKALASLVLLSALAGAQAESPAANPDPSPKTTRKHHARRVAKPTGPSVQSQIETLRSEMSAQQTQIQTLQQQLSSSQSQLTQAQQAAQQAMQQAQDAMAAQNTAIQQNTQSVSTLQSAVTDLTANTASIASTMQADQAATKKAIENPDVVHFKGIGLNFTNSFIEFATVDRTKATASDIPTPFTAIPLSASDAGHLSEFYATGRQSRLAISAVGKISKAQMQAYYELDWLGTGITSNNNQSNSYVMRERQLWAQAALNSGLTVTAGQQWSLATETRHLLDNKTEVLPDTIDPNYNVGFVWSRQAGFRLTQKLGQKGVFGFSVENAQTLNPSCQATTTTGGSASCPVNYVIGATGTGGGLYNATANYSYNLAPDVIAKFAGENKFMHFEVFGIGRFFRNRVYPNLSTTTTGTAASANNAYTDSTVGGGVGGGARFYADKKKLELALHGLWGDGTARYATAQLADLTIRPTGQLAPLHNQAALAEIFAHATPRLDIYADWGYEEVSRRIFRSGNNLYGYGLRTANNSGCGTQIAPSAAGATGGAYPPQTNGFIPGGTATCAGNNKDVTEGTIGYDYYFYKGPMGRFRQGFQFSWIERALWSGIQGTSPKATDELFETNVRYYLP